MLAKALRLIRVFHDLKQVELAEKIGVSKSYISEIESDKKKPSIQIIEKYSIIFKIPVSSIMFFSERIDNSQEGSKIENMRGIIAEKIIKILSFIDEQGKDDNA